MKFPAVRRQLEEAYSRAIRTGLAVKQNFPAVIEDGRQEGGRYEIGGFAGPSSALRDVPYKDLYREIISNGRYHLKFPDGALVQFQYRFNADQILTKHRLAYYPCVELPSADEVPELYERDELFGDIIQQRIVRFPIRFDYDPVSYKPVVHAHSHLSLGQFSNCRIPATHPVSPYAFILFLVRNFYFSLYSRNRNVFDKRVVSCPANECIEKPELRMTGVRVGQC